MKISTAAVLLFAAMPLHADGILAVLKNPHTVERRDAQSGAFKGSISVNNALGVGCDGKPSPSCSLAEPLPATTPKPVPSGVRFP